jgi:hypothetical protein
VPEAGVPVGAVQLSVAALAATVAFSALALRTPLPEAAKWAAMVVASRARG